MLEACSGCTRSGFGAWPEVVYQQDAMHAACLQEAHQRLASLRRRSEVSFGASAVLIVAAVGYLAAQRRGKNALLPQ
jgi:hypothetical protein